MLEGMEGTCETGSGVSVGEGVPVGTGVGVSVGVSVGVGEGVKVGVRVKVGVGVKVAVGVGVRVALPTFICAIAGGIFDEKFIENGVDPNPASNPARRIIKMAAHGSMA